MRHLISNEIITTNMLIVHVLLENTNYNYMLRNRGFLMICPILNHARFYLQEFNKEKVTFELINILNPIRSEIFQTANDSGGGGGGVL